MYLQSLISNHHSFTFFFSVEIDTIGNSEGIQESRGNFHSKIRRSKDHEFHTSVIGSVTLAGTRPSSSGGNEKQKHRVMQRGHGIAHLEKLRLQELKQSGSLNSDNKSSDLAFHSSELTPHSTPPLRDYATKDSGTSSFGGIRTTVSELTSDSVFGNRPASKSFFQVRDDRTSSIGSFETSSFFKRQQNAHVAASFEGHKPRPEASIFKEITPHHPPLDLELSSPFKEESRGGHSRTDRTCDGYRNVDRDLVINNFLNDGAFSFSDSAHKPSTPAPFSDSSDHRRNRQSNMGEKREEEKVDRKSSPPRSGHFMSKLSFDKNEFCEESTGASTVTSSINSLTPTIFSKQLDPPLLHPPHLQTKPSDHISASILQLSKPNSLVRNSLSAKRENRFTTSLPSFAELPTHYSLSEPPLLVRTKLGGVVLDEILTLRRIPSDDTSCKGEITPEENSESPEPRSSPSHLFPSSEPRLTSLGNNIPMDTSGEDSASKYHTSIDPTRRGMKRKVDVDESCNSFSSPSSEQRIGGEEKREEKKRLSIIDMNDHGRIEDHSRGGKGVLGVHGSSLSSMDDLEKGRLEDQHRGEGKGGLGIHGEGSFSSMDGFDKEVDAIRVKMTRFFGETNLQKMYITILNQDATFSSQVKSLHELIQIQKTIIQRTRGLQSKTTCHSSSMEEIDLLKSEKVSSPSISHGLNLMPRQQMIIQQVPPNYPPSTCEFIWRG